MILFCKVRDYEKAYRDLGATTTTVENIVKEMKTQRQITAEEFVQRQQVTRKSHRQIYVPADV